MGHNSPVRDTIERCRKEYKQKIHYGTQKSTMGHNSPVWDTIERCRFEYKQLREITK